MPKAVPTHKARKPKGVKRHTLAQPRDKTYDTSKWRYYLRPKMLLLYPVCMMCGKKPSEHVDHIIALRKGGENTMQNLQALCASCHSRKTARYDRRKGVGGV